MDGWRKDGFVIIKLTCDIKYETSFLYIKDLFLLKSHLFYEQLNYLLVIFQIFFFLLASEHASTTVTTVKSFISMSCYVVQSGGIL